MMRRLLGFFLLLMVLPLQAQAGRAGEGTFVADDLYRGINLFGVTGLINVNSAYTAGSGAWVFGGGLLVYTTATATDTGTPATVTFGLGDRIEIGATGAAYTSTSGAAGLADSEVSWKYRFRQQSEYMPAMALMFSYIAPTGAGGAVSPFVTVTGVGGSVHLLMSSESNLTDTMIIGLYFDLGMRKVDAGNLTVTGFGIVLPMSDDNRFQLVADGVNYGGAVPYSTSSIAFRFTGDAFRWTFAAGNRGADSFTFGSLSMHL